MRFQSYFNTSLKIIDLYDGTLPLHHFLKQYFSQHKKHGSKDRKFITHTCYGFYRLGKAFAGMHNEEKLKISIFICNNSAGEWGFLFDDEWLGNWEDLLARRLQFVEKKYACFSLKDVFPFTDELSESIDSTAFIESFFLQPDFFVRIRPGYEKQVISQLRQKNILFTIVEPGCLALSPFVNIDAAIDINKEAVIQDLSSQKTQAFLKLIQPENRAASHLHPVSVWDCCAGSGGKSILAYDVLGKIDLTASDIRPSIIQNLRQRLAKAGIRNYKSFSADLANAKLQIPGSPFDLIICDAPCTGSGTWSRTPEQLYFFNREKIEDYSLLQQRIAGNAVNYLQPSGYFLFVTCSVFQKENETVAAFIENQLHLTLVKKELLKGYHRKADTMFAALFKKTE